MQNIIIGRYDDPKASGWAGWLEPADRSWIAFVGLDGRPVFFLNRDPVTGAILSDDQSLHAAEIAELRARDRGLHTGVTITEQDGALEGVVNAPGEVVFPLGVSGSGVDVEPPKRR